MSTIKKILFLSLWALNQNFKAMNTENTLCPLNHNCHCTEINLDCSNLLLDKIIPNMLNKYPSQHGVDVDYSHNTIYLLHNTSFYTYAATRAVNLVNNQIQKIESGAFIKLEKCVSVNLSNNLLKDLPESLFNHMKSLNFLYLSRNSLETLPPKIFVNLNSLTHLRLNDNHLKFLPTSILTANLHLETLYLENNLLETAHYQWIQNLHFNLGQGEVYLDNNPWACDCRMKSFYKWEMTNNMFRSDPNGSLSAKRMTVPRCEYPPGHRGKSVRILNESDLKCDKPTITSKSSQNTLAEPGQHIILQCDVESNPPAHISWILPNQTQLFVNNRYKEPEKLLHSNTIDIGSSQEKISNTFRSDTHLSSTLNLTNVHGAKSGLYICVAEGLDHYGASSKAQLKFFVKMEWVGAF